MFLFSQIFSQELLAYTLVFEQVFKQITNRTQMVMREVLDYTLSPFQNIIKNMLHKTHIKFTYPIGKLYKTCSCADNHIWKVTCKCHVTVYYSGKLRRKCENTCWVICYKINTYKNRTLIKMSLCH